MNQERNPIVLEVYKYLPVRKILNNYNQYDKEIETLNKRQGIYFHIYKQSSLPFYIGISNHMLGRNYEHFDCYRKGSYWLEKDPDKLATLDCFKIKGFDSVRDYTQTNFYPPKKEGQDYGPQWSVAVEKLLDHSGVLFATLKPSDNHDASNNRKLLEQVELQLQENLVVRHKVDETFVGRTGSNRGGAIDYIEHQLVMEYVSDDIPRLDESALL